VLIMVMYRQQAHLFQLAELHEPIES